MKKQNLLYLPFVLVLATLVSVTPVFANDGEQCSHLEHTIRSLRACVTHAVEMRYIDNQGVANSLLAKLNTAQAALDRKQTPVALTKLEAFIKEVEAQTDKHINAVHAKHMVMHAEHVIDGLSH